MRRSFVIHVICWGIVIIFPLCFIEHSGNWNQDIGHLLRMLGVQVIFMLPFYLNYSLLIPRVLFKDKLKSFYAFNVLIIILSFGLMLLWQYGCYISFPDTFHENA